jgi:hypothetical protein
MPPTDATAWVNNMKTYGWYLSIVQTVDWPLKYYP